MADHGSRDHATWSASSTARNWQCPGALALSERAPPDKESIHAARGTACHQISEKCLRRTADCIEPETFLGTVEKTKEHEIEIDEELVNSAKEYVDYVLGQFLANPGNGKTIEQKFSLAAFNPPFDAGGTADAVIYDAANRHLEVVDLKNGMGVVDVQENKQLRTYALGAALANPGLAIDKITVTIVQPRAPHKDGRIRSETFDRIELFEWTQDLLAAMRRSKAALDAYKTLTGAVSEEAWAETYLAPGSHCKFCKAEGFCPALKKRALDVAAVWFDDRDQPRIGNTPDSLSPEEIAKTLDMLDMLEDWCNAVRRLAHTMAEQGSTIPGYKLVEKIGNRAWATEDEDKLVADLKKVAGLSDDEIVTRKVKSVAQIEKVLGAKRKNLIDNMWMRPVRGTNLVSEAKSDRPAAKGKAETYFQEIN